jgi:hypothetical protein
MAKKDDEQSGTRTFETVSTWKLKEVRGVDIPTLFRTTVSELFLADLNVAP